MHNAALEKKKVRLKVLDEEVSAARAEATSALTRAASAEEELR